MKTKILMLSIAAALPTAWAADNAEAPPRDGPRPPGERRDGDRPRGDVPTRGERPPMFGPMPLLQPLDTDDDGIISADEIKSAPDSLKKLDKNGDGQISREEWQPQPPSRGDGERPRGDRPRDGERPRGEGLRDGEAQTPEKKSDAPLGREKRAGDQRGRPQGPPPPLVGALDTDRDGVLSADEIGKSPESLAKLDHNKDGQLGPREYGPRPPEGADRDQPQTKPES
jgi:hypothetical protein